ncbi:MAG: hypothetical protein K2N63_10160 [Lachnospiraceae bacterium]|nr:hypothetical protein [Lachnospiraceae bacterium]
MTTLPLPPDAKRLLTCHTRCDRYDYLVAAACGAVGGIVDIFLANLPKNSNLHTTSDSASDQLVITNKMVILFAELSGWKPNILQKGDISSAIDYLEKSYKISYDQLHGSEIHNLMKLPTKNHYMLSLGHSPSPIGLFFSVLSQLTSTSSFLSQGEMAVIPTRDLGLDGDSLVHRIFFGVVNWFGHLMSDIAGSPLDHRIQTDENHGRGTGIILPFYELLSLCKFDKFQVGNARQDLAAIAVRAFQEGYDIQFGKALSVPILLADLLTRFFWAFCRHFKYGQELKDCIPNKKQDDLRIMLIVSNTALCTADILDEAFRFGGNLLTFFPRLNLPAWFLLVWRVFKEVCFSIGMGERELAAYEELNDALSDAIRELKSAGTNLREQTKPYLAAAQKISDASSTEELNRILFEMASQIKLELPWENDFNEHMSKMDGILRFK